MHNDIEKIVLYLTKSEKEYIEECSRKRSLTIEQFLLLCALSLEKPPNKKIQKATK